VSAISIFRLIRKTYQHFVDRPFKHGVILNERYRILQLIGTGSYGMAYLCKDLETMEHKVVKQLRPSKRKEIDLFKKEINLLSKLNHPSMPRVYESFSCDDQFLYIMDYGEGDNLERQIFSRKRTFSEQESLLFFSHLLEMVNSLHRQEIYHLDLRIPNILLKEKKPFLIDFGLAMDAVSDPKEQESHTEMRQQDYFDLGDILLFLLYTTYTKPRKKALPWTEELSLADETAHMLKRLLGLLHPYSNGEEIHTDLLAAINATKTVTEN